MHTTASDVRPLSQRVWDTFANPRRLAAGFREDTPWLGVLMITTLVAIVAAAALPAEFFLSRTENPVNRMGRPVTVTSSPEEVVRWGRYLQMFSAAVEHPVIVLLVASVMMLIFSVLGRGQITMRQHFALTAHAYLIASLGVLLTVTWHLLSGDTEAHPSLALLLGGTDGAAESGVVRFLSLLNPFTLWMLIVLAIGVGELDERRSFASAATILVGLYVALAAVLAMIG